MNCRIFEDLSLLVIGVLGLGSEVLSKADARGLWELDLSALAAGVADGTVSVLRLASGLIHIRLVVLASREVAVVRPKAEKNPGLATSWKTPLKS